MIRLSQAYQNKKKETVEVKVVGVVRHPKGRIVDIILEYNGEFEFEPSDGIGIPASLQKEQLAELNELLRKDSSEYYRHHLIPYQGYPGPDYAQITDEIIEILMEKSISILQSMYPTSPEYAELKEKIIRIFHIKKSSSLTEKLKANYTVIDLLRLFPRVLTAQDVIETTPPEHGNKTYTPDTRVLEPGKENRFRINILKETGPQAYRALFGEEDPVVEKTGMSSGYLHGLQPGDMVTINRKIKKGPQIPEFKGKTAGRPVLMALQGNSMIRSLPLLEDIRKRKEAGEKVGPVVIIEAFRTRNDILELSELRPYIADGTVSAAHFALGKEKTASWERHEKGVYFHPGKRVQKIVNDPLFNQTLLNPLSRIFIDIAQSQLSSFRIFSQWALRFGALSKKTNPFVFISGGEEFVLDPKHSVGKFLANHYGYVFPEQGNTDEDIRFSRSKINIPKLQGEEYPALDKAEALKSFEYFVELLSGFKK